VVYTVPEWKNNTSLSDKAVKYFEGRAISQATLNEMQVYSDREFMPQFGKEVDVICFPYFRGGKLVNIKYRGPEKSFKLYQGAELVFWNIDFIPIDIEKIILLKEAVNATGAIIVLCSSWRYTKKALLLKKLFLENGLVIYLTPFIQNERGLEIKKWLLDNPFVEEYVILDDEIFNSYDEELLKNLIKISNSNGQSFGDGLMPEDVCEVIRRLGRK
jgi:hypothetical protein